MQYRREAGLHHHPQESHAISDAALANLEADPRETSPHRRARQGSAAEGGVGHSTQVPYRPGRPVPAAEAYRRRAARHLRAPPPCPEVRELLWEIHRLHILLLCAKRRRNRMALAVMPRTRRSWRHSEPRFAESRAAKSGRPGNGSSSGDPAKRLHSQEKTQGLAVCNSYAPVGSKSESGVYLGNTPKCRVIWHLPAIPNPVDRGLLAGAGPNLFLNFGVGGFALENRGV